MGKEKRLEQILDSISQRQTEVLNPAFSQCLPVFVLPFAMFLLLPFGAKPPYLVFFFVWMEVFFYTLVQWYRRSNCYFFWSDRIEWRSGLFKTTSKTIPYTAITEINYQQSLYQKILNIGDIYIETAGGTDLAIAMAGIKFPRNVTKNLFILKQRGST